MADIAEHSGGSAWGSASGRTIFGFGRAEVFTIVYAVVGANAVWSVMAGVVERNGWNHALINTFEISLIVWAALYLGMEFILKSGARACKPFDLPVAGLALASAFLPIGPATWVAMSGVALYLILTSRDDVPMSRASWIFLALTVPIFWGRRIFSIFSDYILSADAFLVSLATQTERHANVVQMPGGEGSLVIAAACSSMANVSLAVLCWTLFTQYHGLKWQPRNIAWCLGACVSVAFINVVRIAVIGYFPRHYVFLHEGFGVTIVSWLTVIVCVLVCRYGVAREHVRTA